MGSTMTVGTTKEEDSTTDKMDAEALSDELGTIQIKSVDDETAIGRVKEIYSRNSDKVKIVATLPNGEEVDGWMEKPLPWSDEFKFARIVESKGYDASSVHELEGEEVHIKRDGSSGEFADPQTDEEEGFRIRPKIGTGLAITGYLSIAYWLATAMGSMLDMEPYSSTSPGVFFLLLCVFGVFLFAALTEPEGDRND